MGPPYSPHHNSQAANTHQGGKPFNLPCFFFFWINLLIYRFPLTIVPPPDNLDNGINSSGSSSQHPVTSIITTGPDGTNIDEASQQSTISNASAGNNYQILTSIESQKRINYRFLRIFSI